MRSRSRIVLVSIVVSLTGAVSSITCACGGDKGSAASKTPNAATSKDAPEGGAAGGAGGAASDGGAAQKPFAGSAQEATQLIGNAVDKNSADVMKCVAEYRVRKNLPHERVTISMGIDQEGRLLGATLPKGKTDATLSECVQRVLAGAPFPRSHNGVISITKSYEEIVQ